MPIHPTAQIHPSARVHESVTIGPLVQIGPECEVGSGCELMAGSVLAPRTILGARNRVHYYAVIGHEPQFVGFDHTLPTGTRLGDDNEVREHCFIHRSIYPGKETLIGNRNYFMAHSHVGHDCVLGDHIVLASLCVLAGHVTVGDRVFVSGPAGVHQWCRVGRLAMIGGLTGPVQDVPPFVTVKGDQARVIGLNTVGLRRAGIGAPERTQLRRAFHILFREGRGARRAAAVVRQRWAEGGEAILPPLEELLAFCEAPSKRGILGGALKSARDAEDTGTDPT